MIVYFHPESLGKWSNLTNIFQLGWNHQLVSFSYYSHIRIPKDLGSLYGKLTIKGLQLFGVPGITIDFDKVYQYWEEASEGWWGMIRIFLRKELLEFPEYSKSQFNLNHKWFQFQCVVFCVVFNLYIEQNPRCRICFSNGMNLPASASAEFSNSPLPAILI